MRVFIDDKLFVLRQGSFVVPYLIDPLAQATRDTGVQRRSDFTKYNRVVYDSWAKMGIGWPRMRRNSGYGVGGVDDADAETRFDSGLYLPYLDQDATDSANIHISRFCLNRGLSLYLFGEKDLGGGDYAVYACPWTGSSATWGAGTATATITGAIQLCGGVQSQGDIHIIVWQDGADNIVHYRWDGSSFTAGVVVSVAGDARSGTAAGSGLTGEATITAIEGVLYVAYARGNNMIRVRKSIDNGATWSTVGSDVEGPRVMGATVWFDANGDPAPVFHTLSGVYAVDTSAAVVQLLWEKPVAASGGAAGRGMAVANGRLYVPSSNQDMFELSWDADGVISGQRLPLPQNTAVRRGWIQHMQVAGKWIFCAIDHGTDTGYQPHILAFDYVRWERVRDREDAVAPWHSINLHATASRRIPWLYISSNDDGVARLHWATRALTEDFTATTDERFMVRPLTDPVAAAATDIAYEADGYVKFAEDDFGDPNSDGAIYQTLVDCDGLDTTANNNEKITHKHYADGAASPTTIGVYYSDAKSLTWGSNLGVSLKKDITYLELARGSTNTNTPKLRELEIRVFKNLSAGNLGYLLEIDIAATASAPDSIRDTEQVISDLVTILGTTTLRKFEYGKSGVLYVRPVPSKVGEHTAEGDRMREEGRRTGVAFLQLEEVL